MEQLSYSSRCALVAELVKNLRTRGSWCGETHLQKALYIIQDLSKSNFGYKFVIYKHGPFSFELKSELVAMRAAGILQFEFPIGGYGPSIAVTQFGDRILEVNRQNVESLFPFVEFTTDWFRGNDVRQLEKVATAYYVTRKHPREPSTERARRLNSLKPHVSIEAAEEAVRKVDEKRQQAKRVLAAAV